MSRGRLFPALWLLAPLVCAWGCGSSLPPGGKPVVEFWHGVLQEYPDLPAKVQAIVDERGQAAVFSHGLPSSVTIYGEHGPVTFSGSRIELIVTDLNTPALRQLLEVWQAIPQQAADLGLSSGSSLNPSFQGRKIVVLGGEGRIDLSGVDQQNVQSIRILTDEVASSTTIGIHTFGPSGEAALEELSRNYTAVRGPPESEVNAGHVSLPPPDVSVLVIGKLQNLNIAGPADDASQYISLAAFLNEHGRSYELGGRPVGAPFEARLAAYEAAVRSAEAARFDPPVASVPVYEAPVSSGGGYSGGGYAPVATPTTVDFPVNLPTTPPIATPWTPPYRPNFPPLVVPTPVIHPPVHTPTPVRFR